MVTLEEFRECAIDMADEHQALKVSDICALLGMPVEEANAFSGAWTRTSQPIKDAVWRLNREALDEAKEREKNRPGRLMEDEELCLGAAEANKNKDGKFNFRDLSRGRHRQARQLVRRGLLTLPDGDGLAAFTPKGEEELKHISSMRMKLFHPSRE
jgi:hypothetical protein